MAGESRGPLVRIVFDALPAGVQAPREVSAHLTRVIAGPDRADYCVVVLTEPIWLHTDAAALQRAGIATATLDPQMTQMREDGTLVVQVWALIICSAWVGVPFGPGMKDVPTQVALCLLPSCVFRLAVERDASAALHGLARCDTASGETWEGSRVNTSQAQCSPGRLPTSRVRFQRS